MHQNDTDGDMGRISCTGGILPLFDEMPTHLSQWTDKYVQDEFELTLQYKEYKKYSYDDINEAVLEAMENKQAIGIYTNNLLYLSHILMMYVERNVISFDTAMYTRDAYACGLQSIVRGVKHTENSSVNFKDLTMANVLYGDPEYIAEYRQMLINLVLEYTDVDVSDELKEFYAHFDRDAENPGSLLAKRRSPRLKDINFVKADIEDDIKVLDAITNSFIRNVAIAQPTAGSLRSRNPEVQEVCTCILSNDALRRVYKDKYQLIGQNMTKFGHGTVLGEMFKIWSDLTEVKYQEPKPVVEVSNEFILVGGFDTEC
jgi:hypothetical protein